MNWKMNKKNYIPENEWKTKESVSIDDYNIGEN